MHENLQVSVCYWLMFFFFFLQSYTKHFEHRGEMSFAVRSDRSCDAGWIFFFVLGVLYYIIHLTDDVGNPISFANKHCGLDTKLKQ